MEALRKGLLGLLGLLRRMGLLPQPEIHYIGGSDTLPAPLTREEESRLLAAREGAYREGADVTVAVDGKSFDVILEEIEEKTK